MTASQWAAVALAVLIGLLLLDAILKLYYYYKDRNREKK